MEWQRGASPNVVVTTVGVTSTEVLPSSDRRRGIILCSPLAGTITYAPRTPAIAGQGIVLQVNQAPTLITWEDFGRIVQEPWNAIADAAARISAVIEVVSDK